MVRPRTVRGWIARYNRTQDIEDLRELSNALQDALGGPEAHAVMILDKRRIRLADHRSAKATIEMVFGGLARWFPEWMFQAAPIPFNRSEPN